MELLSREFILSQLSVVGKEQLQECLQLIEGIGEGAEMANFVYDFIDRIQVCDELADLDPLN